MIKPLITILTCTYNRCNLLERLYLSIINQITLAGTVEWLIIDDGSTDNTALYLAKLVERHPGIIRFKTILNGGKYRALNRAAPIVLGEWTMVVDSDDYLLPDAVSNLIQLINVQADSRIGMIAGLLKIKNETNRHFEVKENPTRYTSWISDQRQFDFTPVLRTDLARNNLYPETEGEKYMAESWRYNEISKTHLTLFINKELVCAEYLSDGLSASSRKIRMQSPTNAMIVYSAQYRMNFDFGMRNRAAVNFWRFFFHAKRAGKKNAEIATPSAAWIIPGFILYASDLIKVSL